METIAVDPLSESQWDIWVRSHPDSSIFHSAAWAKVLSKAYAHTPVYLRLCQGGETAALVPMMEVRSILTGRRGICLPFTDLCEPLIFERPAFGAVFESLRALAGERRWKYFEMRSSTVEPPFARHSVEFLGHTLTLNGGVEKLFGGFASSVRRAIRKAERSGLQVRIVRTREAVLEFYRLHCRTRKLHGVPPQPISFFLSIYEEMIRPGAGFIVLANDGPRSLAGGVFLHFGKKAIYKFGASIEDGREIRANNLVMWEGIKALANDGCETLDFGRTSLGNRGLRQFKLGWGTLEKKISYFKFDTSTRAWVLGRDRASGFHTAVFSRLPLALNRLAGELIYPHLD